MKTLLFSVFFILSSVASIAQDDCMNFFPSEEETVLTNKSYDAKDNLLNTLTYKIIKVNNLGSEDEKNMKIRFTMTNNKDSLIDIGILEAECINNVFYMKMSNRCLSPDVINILSTDTKIVGDFLDYPDTFNDDFSLYNNGDFRMNGGKYTIQSQKDKKKFVSVNVHDREFRKNEKITTPAGTFNAAKITFYFDVTTNKKTISYQGVEWYAINAGIVRSETYDTNGNLLNYSVLTSLVRNSKK